MQAVFCVTEGGLQSRVAPGMGTQLRASGLSQLPCILGRAVVLVWDTGESGK